MRLLLVLLVALGLLLPRTGAVLAELAGFESVVICRGADLATVTIAPDGTPVEVEIEGHGPCLAAATPAPLALPAATWSALAADYKLRLPDPQSAPRARPWSGPPPDRAPPLLA
ncbi:hypothetical protein [Jannaschia formosa]|uniref:hypothetical protein n=1 Tax=Jannaschia formosa TaxID=2259592 RepID=UPI001074B43D|nr:hypothetical protein [Jannaschia formosa]TFL18105.1 hypothetical protein DR046_11730 [Jannaschia formosa]